MPQHLIQINSSNPIVRLLTIAVIGLAIVWSVFIVRWYLGNTLAEYFDADAGRADMAQLAVSLAPNDPLTHWRLADFTEKKLPPDQISQAVAEYEKAITLSPNDYRFWMMLGRALEQAGDMDKGEKALRHAIELAPTYSYPHWYLGNLLLRNERYNEAFSELQKASDADAELRPQLFNLAWEVFKDDIESLKTAAGTTSESRAQFSLYLIGRGRVEDGLKLWSSLSEDEKRDNLEVAEGMISALASSFRFHDAAVVWSDIAPGPSYRPEENKVMNGSFEQNVAHGKADIFGWHVQSVPQAQIAIDPNQGHEGSRSVRLVFQVHSAIDLKLSQLVLVKPNTQYDFECYVKTQKLVSAGTPTVMITDATDSATLATSDPAATGDNDWQKISLSFKTGAKTEGLIIRVSRASCGDNAECPMFGTVWYDDFNIKSRD